MKRFLLSKTGLISVCLLTVLMAYMLHRVTTRANTREKGQNFQQGTEPAKIVPPQQTPAASKPPAKASDKAQFETSGTNPAARGEPEAITKVTIPTGGASSASLQENLSYLEQGRSLGAQSRKDKDRQGRIQIRRRTPGGVGEAQSTETEAVPSKKKPSMHLRLEGRTNGKKTGVSAMTKTKTGKTESPEDFGEGNPEAEGTKTAGVATGSGGGTRSSGKLDTYEMESRMLVGTYDDREALSGEAQEARELFCPYGRPIRCELVFTIDSCMEETPLVALVMEPVYNNGQLVIPAGAELHGMARPDRLRDRIFSASDWVLVFPRTGELANGRELRVKGLALDRAEPAADGMSWGITDGSNGLQGQIIRTLENEEIKRFAAGFISASALGLQERQGSGRDGSRFKNSPTNAALQGVAATLEDAAKKIGAEVERHGVFLRVPGGKQFYFYPQQAIHPRMAMIPQPAIKSTTKP